MPFGTGADYCTVKYAATDGALLWVKNYNGPANSNDFAPSVAVDSTGNVVVTGESSNGTNGDYYTAKYAAADGAVLWEMRYGTTQYHELMSGSNHLALTPEGGAVVTGSSSDDYATVCYGPAHEIVVELATGVSLTDGSALVDFGSVERPGNHTATRTFIIRNVGTGDALTGLSISYGSIHSDDAEFVVTVPPASTVAPGGSTSFTITFDPDIAGTIGVLIQIASNDADENPFDIVLVGGSPGSLDFAFDADGKLTTPIGFGDDFGQSVAVQSDGKIVVGGYAFNGSKNEFAVARYHPNGSLDTSFSGDGRTTTPIGAVDDIGTCIAVQSDGKIVVGGYASTGSNYDFALVRYHTDGSHDTSFDSDGIVTTPIGAAADHAHGIAIQSDGKIVLGGYSFNGSNQDFALVRYNPNGSLDNSFNGTGKVTTPVGSGEDVGFGVALQSDERILLAGYSYNGSNHDFALVRYNDNGTLDTTFNTTGKAVTPIGSGEEKGRSVAVQADGRIVVAGSSFSGGKEDFALVRYNANGTLDTTFNGNGKVTAAIRSTDARGYGVAVQPDGKIVVAGVSENNNGSDDMAVARFNPNGSFDTGFGYDGWMYTLYMTTPFGGGEDSGRGVALQSDGGIVVAGYTHNGSNHDFAVVRYYGDAHTGPESWRQNWFGTISNSGSAADSFDFDKDGLLNIVEFAYGLNPREGSSVQLPQGQLSGGNFMISFLQPVGVSGITYGAEWSTTLAPLSWTPITDSGLLPQHTFSVPIGGNEQLFMRLSVTGQ